ncbi:MAG: nickel-dependent hydrogenase large subunit [Nanoarchaeota archaeon]|nr:nickel-dependent hydrogenase large subunit [Nanoarchaeota archaeon]
MHKGNFNISLKNISKIEGHTHMDIAVKNNEAVSVKLKISENKRFYRDAVKGMGYKAAPMHLARICGTCSPAHMSCVCEAVERAMNIRISEQSRALRELLLLGNIIRDHGMHLYFFCLPDIFGVDSVLDFDKKKDNLIHNALHVKEAGNMLCNAVGGRAVHPPFANVGGFNELPSKENVREALKELKEARQYALDFIDTFFVKDMSFKRDTNFVALCGKGFSYIDGVIKTSSGKVIEEEDYREHLEKVIIPYSNASAFEFEFKEFMVGALARLNLNKDELEKSTRKDCSRYLKVFPSNDIFHNNLAQAISVVNAIDKSVKMLESMDFKKEKIPEAKLGKANVGVGVIEAPRGTLYHMIGVDAKGIVNRSEVIIPTSQNVIHLEKSMVDFVNAMLSKGISKEKISMNVERLIRAYDPCMSCATHFLKINWK